MLKSKARQSCPCFRRCASKYGMPRGGFSAAHVGHCTRMTRLRCAIPRSSVPQRFADEALDHAADLLGELVHVGLLVAEVHALGLALGDALARLAIGLRVP